MLTIRTRWTPGDERDPAAPDQLRRLECQPVRCVRIGETPPLCTHAFTDLNLALSC